jgi:hypothetical protein
MISQLQVDLGVNTLGHKWHCPASVADYSRANELAAMDLDIINTGHYLLNFGDVAIV